MKTLPTPATRVDDDSSSVFNINDIDHCYPINRSLTESSNSIPEMAPPSTAPPPQASSIAPPTPITVSKLTNEQGDSPWDSDR